MILPTRKKQKGFTLVELLVVISIIGFLSSIVLASLGTARAKARDTQRIQGLHQMQTALELYYNSYGHYPSYSNGHQTYWNVGWGDSCNGKPDRSKWGGWDYCTGALYSLVTNGFISALPQDPLSNPSLNTTTSNKCYGDSFSVGPQCIGSGYFPGKNGSCYVLGANLEQSSLNTHKNSSGTISGCGGYQISGGCKCSDIQDNNNGIPYYGTID